MFTKDQIQKIGNDSSINVNLSDDFYVYIVGRSDAVKLTANIYIEDIKYCLEKSQFNKRFSGNFKYGAEESQKIKKRLKIIIYLKKDWVLNTEEKKIFEEEFYKNITKANADLAGYIDKLEKFNITFEPDDPNKFLNVKYKYFL